MSRAKVIICSVISVVLLAGVIGMHRHRRNQELVRQRALKQAALVPVTLATVQEHSFRGMVGLHRHPAGGEPGRPEGRGIGTGDPGDGAGGRPGAGRGGAVRPGGGGPAAVGAGGRGPAGPGPGAGGPGRAGQRAGPEPAGQAQCDQAGGSNRPKPPSTPPWPRCTPPRAPWAWPAATCASPASPPRSLGKWPAAWCSRGRCWRRGSPRSAWWTTAGWRSRRTCRPRPWPGSAQA